MPRFNQLNQNFINGPLAFLQANRVINNQNAASAAYGKCYESDARRRSDAEEALRGADTRATTIDIDFVSYRIGMFGAYSGLLPRFVLRPYLDAILPEIAKTPIRTRLNSTLPEDPANVVRGYYFPYKTSGIQTLADVGTVDLPKQNPTHRFAFTGAMNGCGIVITTPTDNANVLRVYHYQNEGDNRRFRPMNHRARDGSTGQGFNLFRGRVHYWFHADEYAGQGDEEVAGFNFLYYADDNRWRLMSLPLRQRRPDQNHPDAGVPMSQSSKAPFEKTFAY